MGLDGVGDPPGPDDLDTAAGWLNRHRLVDGVTAWGREGASPAPSHRRRRHMRRGIQQRHHAVRRRAAAERDESSRRPIGGACRSARKGTATCVLDDPFRETQPY